MSPLDIALKAASPRLSPPPTPWRSLAIHGAVGLAWALAFAGAFVFHGVLGWSTGLIYVGYDTVLLLFVSWQTLVLLRPPRAVPVATSAPDLTVIVAAYNEAGALRATLQALLAQTVAADRIIIADDGSDDATVALLCERFGLVAPRPGEISAPSACHPTLFWLRLPHRGKAAALNAAIEVVKSDIIVTVDADTLLAPEALAAMRRAFAIEPQLVAATGIIIPVCAPTWSGRLLQWFQTYEYVRNFLSRFAWMRLNGLLLISGAFAGFRREAVLAVGGFDSACLVEDYELVHRLRRYGVRHGQVWRTRVLGGATARTDAPASIAGFLRQRRRWFGGFLQTQYWYRDMVGDPRYGALGRAMLVVKAIDTLQPLYGLTAVALLIDYLLRGDLRILLPVAGVMGAKILLDLSFHLWSVHLYRRWVGPDKGAGFGAAFLAALVEPFSFQILRHLGAALGWAIFLTGRRGWGIQRPASAPPGTRPRATRPVS